MNHRNGRVGSVISKFQGQMLGMVGLLTRLGLLLVPTAILLHAALRSPQTSWFLWTGTALQGIVCLLTFVSRSSWRLPIGPSVITLYLIGFCWLWFGDKSEDPFSYLAKAILLVVPVTFFSLQTLQESGAPALRRAHLVAERLANRRDWPNDFASCRMIPEVKMLRAAIANDAAPALKLLEHPRPEVRVAALASLEFRKEWLPGQAELVLQIAQRAEQPAVRAGAVTALGNADSRVLVEALGQFLHDNSVEVRRAAVEALMWDTEHRWNWIRFAVRRILADPLFSNDGPIITDGQVLTYEAVKDLTAWTAEKGILPVRAAQTIHSHYYRELTEGNNPKVIDYLRKLVSDAHCSAILRLEVGKLLQTFHELDQALLAKMLDALNPAPLRLIACETILADDQVLAATLRDQALTTLRDLARLPNREISLTAADIIQRRLGVDLGLSMGQPLPPLQSRQAAEISKKVMIWATQFDDEENFVDSRPRSRNAAV